MSDFQVPLSHLPKHVAVIMDGNGRWAKAKGKLRVVGYKAGSKAVRRTIFGAAKLGIDVVTMFAFSSENWRRPEEEVNLLMDLFLTALTQEVKTLHKNNFQLRIIGNTSQFSECLQEKIRDAEALTAKNSGMIVNIAANYGGKWDITEAAKSIALKVQKGILQPNDINESVLASELTMSDLPEVDLLIRTSGECRISNFMLWQLAYAEMYFTDVFWPDFDEDKLIAAVSWFASRERRFGGISD